MAKLYFYYAAMNAGKTTVLLQSSHNYHERGMRTLLWTPAIDTRAGLGTIRSRIGLEAGARVFYPKDNLFTHTKAEHTEEALSCILVDEAQFLTEEQVYQLSDIADLLRIPVLTYGLRTDFKANLFPGSQALLALADELIELKTICHCGRKATMNMRIDELGRPIHEGEQVCIGGNERYVAVCRRHFKAGESMHNAFASADKSR